MERNEFFKSVHLPFLRFTPVVDILLAFSVSDPLAVVSVMTKLSYWTLNIKAVQKIMTIKVSFSYFSAVLNPGSPLDNGLWLKLK